MSTVATIHSDALGAGKRAAAQLVVVEGLDAGRAARLDASLVVGTDPSCGLVLTDDRVSRRHLEVRPVEGRFALRDLGSRNGTFYEGSRVAEAVVGVGATLKLGRTFVRVAPLPEPIELPPSQSRRFGELVGESLALREVFAARGRSRGWASWASASQRASFRSRSCAASRSCSGGSSPRSPVHGRVVRRPPCCVPSLGSACRSRSPSGRR